MAGFKTPQISRRWALTAAAMMLPSVAAAQVVASRTAAPDPAYDAGGRGFLARSSFVGELQRARHSAADDLAWTLRTGGSWELFRWSSAAVLIGQATQEVVANPFNSLGFNPRGITWEEQLTASIHRGSLDWQLGLFHRCRHEIDNSDPPEQRVPVPGYVPQKRVVVLSGLQTAVYNDFGYFGLRARTAVRAEGYLAREDSRYPLAPGTPDWSRARVSVQIAARLERLHGGVRASYARLWAASSHFSSGPAAGNARLEVGHRISGSGGSAEIFTALERLADDLATPAPRGSRLVGLGFRLAGRGYY